MPLDSTVVAFPNQTPEPNPFAKYDTPSSPIMFPVSERKIGWQMKDGTFMPTDTHKAIVRVDPRNTDRAHVINVVNRTYKMIHNRELFNTIQNAMIERIPPDKLSGVEVLDRVSEFGKTCYREYIFPNIRCTIGGSAKSDIGFRVLAQNGYGGSALRLYAGAIEFWCTNGMIRGLHHSTYRRHTSGCHVAGLDKLIDGALRTFTDAERDWFDWAHTPVSNYRTLEFFKQIAKSPAFLDKLQEHYVRECEHRGQTIWTVYSTLTYYASHGGKGEVFAARDDGNDNHATIMHNREIDVARWVESDKFKELAEA